MMTVTLPRRLGDFAPSFAEIRSRTLQNSPHLTVSPVVAVRDDALVLSPSLPFRKLYSERLGRPQVCVTLAVPGLYFYKNWHRTTGGSSGFLMVDEELDITEVSREQVFSHFGYPTSDNFVVRRGHYNA